MKPAVQAVVLVVAGLSAAYLFVQLRKKAAQSKITVLPPSMVSGAGFVGPALPASTGVVGSKPAAALVGPLPFRGPPAPDETVRVTDHQETPFGWPL